MNKKIKQIISLLNKKAMDTLFDKFEIEYIYWHNTFEYEEIWVKPTHKAQVNHPFEFYWYHLYEYIGDTDRKHLLFIHGRMGNTRELKIYLEW